MEISMKTRAFEEDIETNFKKEAYQERNLLRKKKIDQILLLKRLKAQRKDLVQQETMDLEEKEEQKEEAVEKGYLDLGQHHNKQKRKSKKRCWNCKSPKHLKKHCPLIRCFHCQRLGHMKASCFMLKMEKIIFELERQQKRKQKKRRKKQEDQKKRQEDLSICKERVKQSNFIMESGQWRLKWNDLTIGTYINPGTPRPLEEVREKAFRWKHVEVLLKKPTEVKKLKLEKGFPSSCGCGQITMCTTNEFIKHIYEKHKGVAPPNSLINSPYWFWDVVFDSDEIEQLYCRTKYV